MNSLTHFLQKLPLKAQGENNVKQYYKASKEKEEMSIFGCT